MTFTLGFILGSMLGGTLGVLGLAFFQGATGRMETK